MVLLTFSYIWLTDHPKSNILRNESTARRFECIGQQIVDRMHTQPIRFRICILQITIGQMTGEIVLLGTFDKCQFSTIPICNVMER